MAPAATGRAHGIVAAALCEHYHGKTDVKLQGMTWFGTGADPEEADDGIAGLRIVGKRVFHEGIYDGGQLVAESTSPVERVEHGQRLRRIGGHVRVEGTGGPGDSVPSPG